MSLTLAEQILLAFCAFVGGGFGFVAAVWYIFNYFSNEIITPLSHVKSQMVAMDADIKSLSTAIKSIKFISIGENSHELVGMINDMHAKVNEMAERTRVDFMLDTTARFEFDGNGFCTSVNEAFCQLTGVSNHESLDRGWLRGIHQHDEESVVKSINSALVSGVPVHLKKIRLSRDSERLIHIRIEPLKLENEVKYVGVVSA